MMPITNQREETLETATFGAGCFWGVEEAFSQIEGVMSTAAGYSGGRLEQPSYEDVCSGQTGHTEVVQILYDPAQVSYDELLQVFWRTHTPTGSKEKAQYRSVIFFHSPEQEHAAERSRDELDRSGRWQERIVTAIEPAAPFYRAEEYHQHYLRKHRVGAGYR